MRPIFNKDIDLSQEKKEEIGRMIYQGLYPTLSRTEIHKVKRYFVKVLHAVEKLKTLQHRKDAYIDTLISTQAIHVYNIFPDDELDDKRLLHKIHIVIDRLSHYPEESTIKIGEDDFSRCVDLYRECYIMYSINTLTNQLSNTMKERVLQDIKYDIDEDTERVMLSLISDFFYPEITKAEIAPAVDLLNDKYFDFMSPNANPFVRLTERDLHHLRMQTLTQSELLCEKNKEWNHVLKTGMDMSNSKIIIELLSSIQIKKREHHKEIYNIHTKELEKDFE